MVLLDIVFSFDSIITAVGMANELWVMTVAIVIAVAVMLAAAARVAGFINRHPTVKVLVLAFLLLIGTALLADGFGLHVPKGYIYVAIGFSIAVEMLNQLAARRRRPDREVGSHCRGRNMAIEFCWAIGYGRLPALTADLIRPIKVRQRHQQR
jgi:predicted tellurium resistance membrane protein TerC